MTLLHSRVFGIRPTIDMFATNAVSAIGQTNLLSTLAFAVHVFDGVPQKLHN
jgi:hypothetical protein